MRTLGEAAQYSGMKAAFENPEKGRRTMNSNRLAVCAASLQCTDEEKIVSCLSMAVFGVGREWILYAETEYLSLLGFSNLVNYRVMNQIACYKCFSRSVSI